MSSPRAETGAQYDEAFNESRAGSTSRVPAASRAQAVNSPVECLFKIGDRNLLHFQHRLHGAVRLRAIWIA